MLRFGRSPADSPRYHWSVEYFEDLRNVNHCEFIVMKQNPANGKYILQNELRTWSDLKRRAAAAGAPNGSTPTQSRPTPISANANSSPTIPVRRWGGCANGCNHDKMNWPRRVMRKNTADFVSNQPMTTALPPSHLDGEKDDHPIACQEATHAPTIKEPTPVKPTRKSSTKTAPLPPMPLTPASPNDASDDASTTSNEEIVQSSEQEEAAVAIPRAQQHPAPRTAAILRHLHPREYATNKPGTPGEGFSDDSDYFPGMQHLHAHANGSPGKSKMRASSKARHQSKERKAARKVTEKGWMAESGMLAGARADALGDGDELSDELADLRNRTISPTTIEGQESMPILKEALKGDMVAEKGPVEGPESEEELTVLDAEAKVGEKEIERLKMADRKSLSEIY